MMLRRFSVNFAIASMVLDVFLTTVALLLAVRIRPLLSEQFSAWVPEYQLQMPLILYLLLPIVWVVILTFASVYDPQRTGRVVDELQTLTLAIVVATLVFSGVLYLIFYTFSRWLFVSFVLIDALFLISWRLVARLLIRASDMVAAERLVLIVGAGHIGQRVGEMISNHSWTGVRLAGYVDDDAAELGVDLPIYGRIADTRHIVAQHAIDDVVVALPQQAYGQINRLVLALHDLPVQVRVVPDYFSLALYRATAEDFGGVPMINLRAPALNEVQRLIKRLFDLTVTGFILLGLLPFMSLIAILIKLDSDGPILFRQMRVGENGRLFGMYKFRSMVPDAEKMQPDHNHKDEQGRVVHKRANDPRVTRVGQFLRRTSLDELPQLLNVLKGEMSLVGPRPELPWLVEQYEPWQHKRLAVPQGMTGWWQVNGRSDKVMHLHTEDDLYYIQNYSIWMDIYILLKTPWVVMRGKGAY